MLKVLNPHLSVGSIECLQSAQNWQRKSHHFRDKFTAVRTHQAHHGKISLRHRPGSIRLLPANVPIFLAKDQTIHITMEETHEIQT